MASMDSDLREDWETPQGILTGIRFGILSAEEIEKFSTVQIVEANSLTNPKLGLPNPSSECATCGATTIKDCTGHSGFIKLPRTIYHPYFVPEVVQILNKTCPVCKSARLDGKIKGSFEPDANPLGQDAYEIKASYKKLNGFERKLLRKLGLKISGPPMNTLSRGTKIRACIKKPLKVRKNLSASSVKLTPRNHLPNCKYCSKNGSCGEWYPTMKFKVLSGKKNLSIAVEINEKLPKKFKDKPLREVLPQDYWYFLPKSSQQKPCDGATKITLSPYQVFNLLKELDKKFIEQYVPSRNLLFLSCVPVSPNSHRVTETMRLYANGPQLTFDERTKACKRLFFSNRSHPDDDVVASLSSRVFDCLKMSKLHASSSFSKDPSGRCGLRWMKDVVLSKVTDYAFRMTVVGDPNIRLDEIGVPLDVSERLLIAERVTLRNLQKLKRISYLNLLQNSKLFSRRTKGDLNSFPSNLQVGDTLYRPLEDGDIVLVNRPPSVHQHSLIAFYVKILQKKSVISLNPLCCTPFYGDFDGDCLHGFIPQSICSRVELSELVTIKQQLFNGQDGRTLVSLSHDGLTAAYLLTGTNVFVNQYQLQQLQMLYPPHQSKCPTILKASSHQMPLWTGQQLFSSFLPDDFDYSYNSKGLISKGEMLFSPKESFWLQHTADGVISRIVKHYGSRALDILFSVQEALCEWISMRGFSVSLSDIYLAVDGYTRNKLNDEVDSGLQEADYACYVTDCVIDPRIVPLLRDHSRVDDSLCIRGLEQESMSYYKQKAVISKHSSVIFRDVIRDLQTVISQFASNENSMLAMIRSGSKGSLAKLFQQSVCLGLQHARNSYSLGIGHKFFGALRDNKKASGFHQFARDTPECARVPGSYAVVRSSFLDGLNPLECFLHSLSGRANLFSENAEVPGTLNRKLMFYMRDLYVAYDGTVRNPYGQQVVQFSYDNADLTMTQDDEFCKLYTGKLLEDGRQGGQPVGALASCSLTEAAYGALDQPVNALEDSPLINLKKLFNSGPKTKSDAPTISLLLSKKLKRWNYGFEYGALEVKSHLERVLLSDVVSTVLIVYAGQGIRGTHLSPWISHFHISKERITERRLTVQNIVDLLKRKYNSAVEKKNNKFPRLHIYSRTCSYANEQIVRDETFCITVAAEGFESSQLDTMRHMLPVLLNTVIKGFLEFKKVDILWDDLPNSNRFHRDPCDRLYLKVTISDDCKPGQCWSALQDSCIPIMDLIDWECSHPDNMDDICRTYGIDATWKYFLRSLKVTISDIGRTIHEAHLRIIADCLSVTGKFHGLSAKGLTLQRNQASVSSPFTQACFSSPANSFINAGKVVAADHLLGTIDAVAWGKEPPVGTGGPFQILYSAKVNSTEKPGNVYESLNTAEEKEDNGLMVSHQEDILARRSSQDVSDKLEKFCKYGHDSDKDEMPSWQCISDSHDTDNKYTSNEFISGKLSGLQDGGSIPGKGIAKPRAQNLWENKPDSCIRNLSYNLKKILIEYPENSLLEDSHKFIVMTALAFHPNRDAKIGVGVQEVKIGHNPRYPDSRCFVVVRKDGTSEDFSYHKCLDGAAKEISLKLAAIREKIQRH